MKHSDEDMKIIIDIKDKNPLQINQDSGVKKYPDKQKKKNKYIFIQGRWPS